MPTGERRRRRLLILLLVPTVVVVAAVAFGVRAKLGASPAPGGGGGPEARINAVMAYDAAHGEVVLFGGRTADGGALGDTWVWNGDTWNERHPATSPSARYGATMGFDPRSRRVVLAGGLPNGGAETWTWDGGDWHREHPAHMPVDMTEAVMADDPPTGQLVLVTMEKASPSATPVPGLGFLRATWIWRGGDWVRQSGATPSSSVGPQGIAYDGSIHRLALLGVNYGDCKPAPPGSTPPPCRHIAINRWTWDGGSWSDAGTTGTHEPDRLVPLGDGSGLLLLTQGESWIGRGGTWVRQSDPEMGQRSGFTLVSDPAHHVVLMFGGSIRGSLGGDTWSYDGVDWTHREGAEPSPTPFTR